MFVMHCKNSSLTYLVEEYDKKFMDSNTYYTNRMDGNRERDYTYYDDMIKLMADDLCLNFGHLIREKLYPNLIRYYLSHTPDYRYSGKSLDNLEGSYVPPVNQRYTSMGLYF